MYWNAVNVLHYSMAVGRESGTLEFMDQIFSRMVCDFTYEVSQHNFTQ